MSISTEPTRFRCTGCGDWFRTHALPVSSECGKCNDARFVRCVRCRQEICQPDRPHAVPGGAECGLCHDVLSELNAVLTKPGPYAARLERAMDIINREFRLRRAERDRGTLGGLPPGWPTGDKGGLHGLAQRLHRNGFSDEHAEMCWFPGDVVVVKCPVCLGEGIRPGTIHDSCRTCGGKGLVQKISRGEL